LCNLTEIHSDGISSIFFENRWRWLMKINRDKGI
jgi:hypothetical protein